MSQDLEKRCKFYDVREQREKSIMNCGGGQKEFQMSMNWIRTKELHLAHVCLLETLWFKHCSVTCLRTHCACHLRRSVSFISFPDLRKPCGWPLHRPQPFPGSHMGLFSSHWTVLKTQTCFQWLHCTCSWGGPLLSQPPFSLDLFNAY